MLTKIGIGILEYILGFYFIVFITVQMLKFLCKSFVGISLSEACHRLVWGKPIPNNEDTENREKELISNNDILEDLLEDSKDYKMNYKSNFLTSDCIGIDLVRKTSGGTIKRIEENAPIGISSTKMLNQYQFTNIERAKEFAKMSTVMGYNVKIEQLTNNIYNVMLIDEEE